MLGSPYKPMQVNKFNGLWRLIPVLHLRKIKWLGWISSQIWLTCIGLQGLSDA